MKALLVCTLCLVIGKSIFAQLDSSGNGNKTDTFFIRNYKPSRTKTFFTANQLFINRDSSNNSISKDTNIRICTPSKSQLLKNNPLYVIKSHNQTFFIQDSSFSNINVIQTSWIKTINVLSNPQAKESYGAAAKNGAIEVFLTDEKYPDALKSLQNNIKNGNKP